MDRYIIKENKKSDFHEEAFTDSVRIQMFYLYLVLPPVTSAPLYQNEATNNNIYTDFV